MFQNEQLWWEIVAVYADVGGKTLKKYTFITTTQSNLRLCFVSFTFHFNGFRFFFLLFATLPLTFSMFNVLWQSFRHWHLVPKCTTTLTYLNGMQLSQRCDVQSQWNKNDLVTFAVLVETYMQRMVITKSWIKTNKRSTQRQTIT